jgi:hypothetical protein
MSSLGIYGPSHPSPASALSVLIPSPPLPDPFEANSLVFPLPITSLFLSLACHRCSNPSDSSLPLSSSALSSSYSSVPSSSGTPSSASSSSSSAISFVLPPSTPLALALSSCRSERCVETDSDLPIPFLLPLCVSYGQAFAWYSLSYVPYARSVLLLPLPSHIFVWSWQGRTDLELRILEYRTLVKNFVGRFTG